MIPLANSTIYEMEQRGEFPRRSLKPFLAEFAEALRLFDAALLTLLFDGRGDAISNRSPGIDAFLSGPRE
jgi:hypothetical protein